MAKLVECVPNFSEGRRPEVIEAIAAEVTMVPNVKLLDVKPDASHNRVVVTFVGEPEAVARFGGGVTDITLKYDPNRGIFVPDVSSEGLIERGMIELRMPLMI